MLPPNLPRLFSLNGNVKEWLSLLDAANSHDNARTRRVAIAGMKVPLPLGMQLVSDDGQSMLDDADQEALREATERERQWWLSRAGRQERCPDLAAPLMK